MNLKIINSKNFFKIIGDLTQENIEVFNKTFKNVFNSVTDLTICIEDVEVMDDSGIVALKELYNLSKIDNRTMSIIGDGNRTIYKHFNTQEVAA